MTTKRPSIASYLASESEHTIIDPRAVLLAGAPRTKQDLIDYITAIRDTIPTLVHMKSRAGKTVREKGRSRGMPYTVTFKASAELIRELDYIHLQFDYSPASFIRMVARRLLELLGPKGDLYKELDLSYTVDIAFFGVALSAPGTYQMGTPIDGLTKDLLDKISTALGQSTSALLRSSVANALQQTWQAIRWFMFKEGTPVDPKKATTYLSQEFLLALRQSIYQAIANEYRIHSAMFLDINASQKGADTPTNTKLPPNELCLQPVYAKPDSPKTYFFFPRGLNTADVDYIMQLQNMPEWKHLLPKDCALFLRYSNAIGNKQALELERKKNILAAKKERKTLDVDDDFLLDEKLSRAFTCYKDERYRLHNPLAPLKKYLAENPDAREYVHLRDTSSRQPNQPNQPNLDSADVGAIPQNYAAITTYGRPVKLDEDFNTAEDELKTELDSELDLE